MIKRITGNTLNESWSIGAAQARYSFDGKWYHPLERFPAAFCDPDGYVVFESREDYKRCSQLQLKKDVHAPAGIKSIPGYVYQDKNEPLDDDEYLALAVVEGKIRVVSLYSDGTCEFVDPNKGIHSILYAYSRERAALTEAVEEFEDLINDPEITEDGLQNFFEEHPEFILDEEYRRAHSKIVLERPEDGDLIPDFVLEPYEKDEICDLLELKKPSARVFVLKKNRFRFSAEVMEAAAQLREYSLYFDERENRNILHRKYGLVSYRPRMFVILGRAGDVDPIALRRAELNMPDLTVRTYDNVLKRMKRKLEMYHSGAHRQQ